MRCRVVVCAACCTRLGGINHCHACVAALARAPAQKTLPRALGSLAAAVLLATSGLVLFGLAWLFAGWLAP
jgi:hypothetical protein